VTRDLFSLQGIAALRELNARDCLLVFDLDGTLAPIVSRPEQAAVPQATASRLRELAKRWQVAVITGRSVADAAHRLGFSPQYLAGNHGAESGYAVQSKTWRRALDACRRQLLQHGAALRQKGIELEDKGLSLALHFRRAHEASDALAWLCAFRVTLGSEVTTSLGHCVLNIVPTGAWDKGDALRGFIQACRASVCLVVGDDVNDEPAFRKAPIHSVTVRIGSDNIPTGARFRLASRELVDPALDLLLALHH
jgi:trehalose 6-phosphate phosphatase